MSESVWVEVGEALRMLFWDELGKRSEHKTLKVQQILVTMLREPADWDIWASEELLPTLIVEGRFNRQQAGQHGTILNADGVRRIGKEYPYIIGVIAQGEREEAERNTKILIKRIERILLTRNTLRTAEGTPLVDDNGEQVQDMQLAGTTGINMFRKPDGENRWYGLGAVSLTVRTFTGA